MTQLEQLKSARADLIRRMEAIDAQRKEVQALIVERNRQAGVSKLTIARLRDKDARLLKQRGMVREELGRINGLIKLQNVSVASARVNDPAACAGPVTLAQRFVEVVRGAVSREQFDLWMRDARRVPA